MTEVVRSREIRLAQRPQGLPQRGDFTEVEVDCPPLQAGQVLVKVAYLSVDPYMRNRMREGVPHTTPFALGSVVPAAAIGRVVRSNDAAVREGDLVQGMLGWQTYAVANAATLGKLDPAAEEMASTAHLHVLGIPGLTAFFGLLDIGKPRQGETVVVSAAAGAVGSIAGQIAKLKGCRVVGIVGSDGKADYLVNELGFDAAVNYRTDDMPHLLRNACGNGVDVYFDNVGGEVSDAVMDLINIGARISVCGQISMYNLDEVPVGPRYGFMILRHRALMHGFIVHDYVGQFDIARKQLAKWWGEGKIRQTQTIVRGFGNTVDAFLGLFSGENKGKQIVAVDEH